MNDFEEVINDLKMVKDRATKYYLRNVGVSNINFIEYDDEFIEIIQNAIDLLEEYNNDRG